MWSMLNWLTYPFPHFYKKTQYRNEGRDRLTGSTLITHNTQYRNEGRDMSTGSTLITHKTQYKNEGRDKSTGSTLITHKIQEMRKVIGQPVQH
jgi:hypothetical protein